MANIVNHPSYYNTGRYEAINVIEDWRLGFNDGNAVKYISRYRYKEKPVEDLKKAWWYLTRELVSMHGVSPKELCEICATIMQADGKPK